MTKPFESIHLGPGYLQFRSAKRTPRCLDRDRRKTMGTLFGCRLFGRSLRLPFEIVKTSDDKKNGKSDDNEANDRIDKHPLVESHCPGLLRVGKRGKRSRGRAFFQ